MRAAARDIANGHGHGTGGRGRGTAQTNSAAPSPNNTIANRSTSTLVGGRDGSGRSSANTTLNGNRPTARTHNNTYPSPSPSSVSRRGGTPTHNHRHHSRGRSISVTSESFEARERVGRLGRVSVDATTVSNGNSDITRTRIRTMTRVPVTATAPTTHTTCRVRPSTEMERSRSTGSVPRLMATPTPTLARTRTWSSSREDSSFASARSERTMSWVAQISAALPSVPESTPALSHGVGMTRTGRRLWQTPPDAVHGTAGKSPPVPVPSLRVTVDTSQYDDVISVSSSNSSERKVSRCYNMRSDRSYRTAPLPLSSSASPSGATKQRGPGPEIWVDRGLPHSLSQSLNPSPALGSISSYRTPEYSPATGCSGEVYQTPLNLGRDKVSGRRGAVDLASFAGVTQVETVYQGPSQRAGASRAGSVPQPSSISRNGIPQPVPHRTPAGSSKTTPLAQPQPQIPKSPGPTPAPPQEVGTLYSGLFCRCTGICSSCNLIRMPVQSPMAVVESSVTMKNTEQEQQPEPPHVVNVDGCDLQFDPRSPIPPQLGL
jgi:hypothetical protein